MKINQYFKASAKSSLNKVNILLKARAHVDIRSIILNVFVFILFSTLLDKVYAEEGETGGDWGRLGEAGGGLGEECNKMVGGLRPLRPSGADCEHGSETRLQCCAPENDEV